MNQIRWKYIVYTSHRLPSQVRSLASTVFVTVMATSGLRLDRNIGGETALGFNGLILRIHAIPAGLVAVVASFPDGPSSIRADPAMLSPALPPAVLPPGTVIVHSPTVNQSTRFR
jgi:hypothetical protein